LILANQSIWFYTNIPSEIVDIIEKDLQKNNIDKILEESRVGNGKSDHDIRNAKNVWIPTSHWIGGFLWYYADRANRENFKYDLTCVDGENLQYTLYKEGDHYTWHTDQDLATFYKPQNSGGRDHETLVNDFIMDNTENVRKLSFSLQLSEDDSYEGGQFQLLDGLNSYIVPRQKGTIVFFDSRTPHRVRKVTKGVRKSIVGWILGPRWR
jgi:PKHD-type hydroxylase